VTSPTHRPDRELPTLETLPDPSGRRVLVRADLDIPVSAASEPGRSRQLRQLAPTVHWLLERGALVTICGHQGTLGSAHEDGTFERTIQALQELYPRVSVAPNLCADEGTVENPELLDRLVYGQDLFVNDDFQWSSAPLTSIVGPPSRLPSAAGRQLEKDVALLTPLLATTERPFVVVLGSRDTVDRLPNLYSLVLRADGVLVGGQMSVPFLEAIGKQPESDEPPGFIDECRHAYGVGHEIGHPIQLPSDLVWECRDGRTQIGEQDDVLDGSIMDIGPNTARTFGEIIRGARTVFWAGSLGRVEDVRFAQGTLTVAQALAGSSATTIFGGDALLHVLRANDLLPLDAPIVSATGSAIALLKDGDLVGLAALREQPG